MWNCKAPQPNGGFRTCRWRKCTPFFGPAYRLQDELVFVTREVKTVEEVRPRFQLTRSEHEHLEYPKCDHCFRTWMRSDRPVA